MYGRLAIPFIGPGGNVYDLRFRCLDEHDHKDPDVHCPKYLGSEGIQTRLYNTRALASDSLTIAICEGELDAATLTVCGWAAVGVTGAKAWKAHHPRMFSGFDRVVVIGDGDSAGKDFVSSVVRSMPSQASGVIMSGSQGSDINEVYVNSGKAGLIELLKGDSE